MNPLLDDKGLNHSLPLPDVTSLSKVWAKKYVKTLHKSTSEVVIRTDEDVRQVVAQTLHQQLRTISAQAWTKTEYLLAKEIFRHQLDTEDLDPWAIAGEVHDVYMIAFDSYARSMTPERFAVNISTDLGRIRKRFTANDPRVIGFVSMQFHYTGQLLLEQVGKVVGDKVMDETQGNPQSVLIQYFNAIDDHLYMPLQRAYAAAATYAYAAPELKIVQSLLPKSSAIAQRVVKQILIAFPKHQCYSGALDSFVVQQSSLRDAEMFQVYIWVALLENNLSVVQQELFPLCVMLYPMFNVSWDMVRAMLGLLELEFSRLLPPKEFALCSSYMNSLKMMFDPEVVNAIS